MELEFEWDENKRQKCLIERGIDFLDAALVWDDPKRQERIDSRRDHGETRYQTIGRSELGVLFIVYTVREYEQSRLVHRIISVRKAKKSEVSQYHKHTFALGLAS